MEVAGQPVQHVRLQAPAGFDFAPGQYLAVVHESGAIPLSIASAPWRLPELHLYYRSSPGLAEARWMDALLAAGDDLYIRGPFGNVSLHLPLAEPLVIVCGGTGGAQALGMLDALTKRPPEYPVALLWCADDGADLAAAATLQSIEAPWLRCEFITDARRTADNRALQRLRALAPEFRPLLGPAHLPPARIVLSGSPGFVYAVTDLLTNTGIPTAQLTSDVYDYAPRR